MTICGSSTIAAQDDLEGLARLQRDRDPVLRRREQRLAGVGVLAQRELDVEGRLPAQLELEATGARAADDVLARRSARSVVWTSIAADRRVQRAEPGELADLAVLGAEHGPVGGEEAHVRAR